MLNPLRYSLLLVSLAIIIIPLWSSGASGINEGGLSGLPDDTPLLLTENNVNKDLRFWAPPGVLSIVYDQWTFYLFGEVNDAYKVIIGGSEAFNSSLTHSYVNLSFDATAISQTSIRIEIGNRTYQWLNVVINHQAIGYSGPGGSGVTGEYFESDLNKARLRSALGVVIAGLLSMPVVWSGVRLWRSKQGVKSWI